MMKILLNNQIVIITDKEKIYDEIKDEFSNYVSSKDYKSILRVFNNKGLIANSNLCKLTGLDRKEAYIDLVLSLLKKDDGISNTIRKAIISQIQRKQIQKIIS